MMSAVIVDTGPLVAILTKNDTYHQWVNEQLTAIEPPLLTCEAVIVETMFVVRDNAATRQRVLRMLKDGVIRLNFSLEKNLDDILGMVQRYNNIPMSLADASLVRMSEIMPQSKVLTLDSDFQVYRKNSRHVIPLISPWR
jgi:predicted nucleic acid-binding protein